MRKIFTLTLLVLFAAGVSAQTTATVTFKVTTVTASGQYAPKHVLAIWVTNSSGTFQKSIKVMAAVRKQYLYQWKAANSSQNVTGAITGATINSHQTHTVSWNCQNYSGTLLPDGDYKIWVEFTEKDGQGPYTSYTFTKGTTPDTLSFSNAANFTNVQIIYTPSPSGISDAAKEATVVRFSGDQNIGFKVPSQLAENASLQIFDLGGKLIFETADYFDNGTSRYFLWKAASQCSGMYIYRIESGADWYGGKLFR